jgi:hypothetical protein
MSGLITQLHKIAVFLMLACSIAGAQTVTTSVRFVEQTSLNPTLSSGYTLIWVDQNGHAKLKAHDFTGPVFIVQEDENGDVFITRSLDVPGDTTLGSSDADTVTINAGPINLDNATNSADGVVVGSDQTVYRVSDVYGTLVSGLWLDGSLVVNRNVAYPQFFVSSTNSPWIYLIDPTTPNTAGGGNSTISFVQYDASGDAMRTDVTASATSVSAGNEDSKLTISVVDNGTSENQLEISNNGVDVLDSLSVDGGATLGDSSSDSVTINAGPVSMPNATSAADGLVLGGDAVLYRSSADVLKTDDSLSVASDTTLGDAASDTVTINAGPVNMPNATSAADGLIFSDTVLYRSSTDVLMTDDSLTVAGNATIGDTESDTHDFEGLTTVGVGDTRTTANETVSRLDVELTRTATDSDGSADRTQRGMKLTALNSGSLTVQNFGHGRLLYGLECTATDSGTTNNTGQTPEKDVFGISSSATVSGTATGASTRTAYGVRGSASGTSDGTTIIFGVAGTTSSTSQTKYGVYGSGTGSSGTTHYGVFGTATGATTNYSGYFDLGTFQVNGDAALGDAASDTVTINAGPVNMPNATSAADGLVLGGDAALYRSSADVLQTDDNVTMTEDVNAGNGVDDVFDVYGTMRINESGSFTAANTSVITLLNTLSRSASDNSSPPSVRGYSSTVTNSGTWATTSTPWSRDTYGAYITALDSGNSTATIDAPKKVYGVYSEASASGTYTVASTRTTYGVYGAASSTSAGSSNTAYGVYGTASGSGTNYAVYSAGDLASTGNTYLGNASTDDVTINAGSVLLLNTDDDADAMVFDSGPMIYGVVDASLGNRLYLKEKISIMGDAVSGNGTGDTEYPEELIRSENNGGSWITLKAFGTSGVTFPSTQAVTSFTGARARGTYSSKTAIADDDIVATFQGQGWDGNSWWKLGEMRFVADGTVADDNIPSRIEFLTNAGTVSTATIQWEINSAGDLKSTVSDNGITVDGTLTANGAVALGDASGDAITLNGSMTQKNTRWIVMPVEQGWSESGTGWVWTPGTSPYWEETGVTGTNYYAPIPVPPNGCTITDVRVNMYSSGTPGSLYVQGVSRSTNGGTTLSTFDAQKTISAAFGPSRQTAALDDEALTAGNQYYIRIQTSNTATYRIYSVEFEIDEAGY